MIKRHFWIKRQAIIDQAQQLIVKLREEYEEIEKSKKRGHAGSCASHNPSVQVKKTYSCTVQNNRCQNLMCSNQLDIDSYQD